MVDFACDANGSPILAVSSLAVHTKDLSASPKCSLLVSKDPEDRTDLVITVHGDALPIPETEREAIRSAYLARHPEASCRCSVTKEEGAEQKVEEKKMKLGGICRILPFYRLRIGRKLEILDCKF